MEQVSRDWIGFCSGDQRFSYSWRDVALYNLAVGTKRNQLQYHYEKDLQVLPCFGVVPFFGTFGWQPQRPLPWPAAMNLKLKPMSALHMAHSLVLHKPLNPYGADLLMRDTITDIFDHQGKAIVVRSELVAYDEAGEPVFTNIGDMIFRGYTCQGAEPYPRADISIPERLPDAVLQESLSNEQHLLYRLCGDTNIGHVDDEMMQSIGRKGAIMQGMCSFGFACRMAMQALGISNPAAVQRLGVEMRNVVYPGANIELHLWRLQAGQACFRLRNLDDDNLALERGYICWE